MKRFSSRQYNFDENNSHRGNGNYSRRNWRRLGRNLSFADESFYFRQPHNCLIASGIFFTIFYRLFFVTEKLLIAKKYLTYQFNAKNAHGIHSPFVFKLYNEVIASKKYYYAFDEIEALRAKLFQNHKKIQVTDLGAGSKVNNDRNRKISSIAKVVLNEEKTGQMLFRLVDFLQAENILELGTSLGINTLYLATPMKNNHIFTFEGCPNTLAIAKDHFDLFKAKNIETIEGNIDNTLSTTLQKIDKVDIVIFDANHQKAPTLQYFEQCLAKAHENSVFIFDDIYWSTGMMAAWEQIKVHQKVTLSIDLFDLGIVFFRNNQPKQHFILKF